MTASQSDEKFCQEYLAIPTQCTSVTNGQTDKSNYDIKYRALHLSRAVKKTKNWHT